MNEEFVDFEGDPTSINQIPRDSAQGTPRPSGGMHPPPGAQPPPNQFASASPSLSHIGGPSPPQQYGSNPGLIPPPHQSPHQSAQMTAGMTMTAGMPSLRARKATAWA